MKKTKIFKWTLSVLLVFLVFQASINVKADDDDYGRDHKKHDRYERYERHDWEHKEWEDEDHDDRDEHEWEENESKEWTNQYDFQQSYWNIWTRNTISSMTENLPIQEAKEVTVEIDGKSKSMYVIPLDGQLLISGEKMAQLCKIKYKFYPQSRILEVLTDTEELIIRAGSNVAYENMVKTPMPTKALYYEKSVYLPISVIANTFGYRVSWNEEKGSIILEKI